MLRSGLIATKIGNSSYYHEDGMNTHVTVLKVDECIVASVKTFDKDGYNAVQLGFDEQKESRLGKASLGHFKKANTVPLKKVVEFASDFDEVSLGDTVNVELFAEGDYITVAGVSKGKGFQGVVKRHNFRGVGDATHGQHNRLRAPGSIGAASYPARVFKGMRMAGQMGNERVKVENLQVLKVLSEKNIIVVKGSVPGSKGSTIIIEK